MRFYLVFPWIFLLVFSFSAKAEFKVKGNVKGHGLAGKHGVLGGKGAVTQASLMGSFRLKLTKELNSQQSTELSFKGLGQWVGQITQGLLNPQLMYRIDDLKLNPSLDNSEQFYFEQNLDRALWRYSTENWDVVLGRQAISFGSGRLVNPTDVLLPFPVGTIDSEYRIGVDGIRAKRSIGEMGEIDGGVVFGQYGRAENNAYYLSLRGSYEGVDTGMIYMSFRKNQLFGVDLQGSLLGQGVWLEYSYNEPREETDVDKAGFSRLVLGGDYRFNDELYTYLEYHLNGAGSENKSKYSKLINKVAYRESGIYFVGQNYLSPGVQYLITPLLNYGVSIVGNLDDRSLYYTQKLQWNCFEDHFIDLTLFLGDGESGTEFGEASNFGFASYRHYF